MSVCVYVCVCIHQHTAHFVYKAMLCGSAQRDLAQGRSHVCICGCVFIMRAGGSGGIQVCTYRSDGHWLKDTIHQQSQWCRTCFYMSLCWFLVLDIGGGPSAVFWLTASVCVLRGQMGKPGVSHVQMGDGFRCTHTYTHTHTPSVLLIRFSVKAPARPFLQ